MDQEGGGRVSGWILDSDMSGPAERTAARSLFCHGPVLPVRMGSGAQRLNGQNQLLKFC